MLSKDQLDFDPTDAVSIAESDKVGAYILGAGGEVATTSTLGAVEALDVAIQNTSPIDVNVTNAAASATVAEDSAHTSGDNGQFILGVRQDADVSPVDADGDYHSLIFDNLGRLKVAADLDLTSGIADDDVDSENPLKVGSRAIDGLLPAISASGDKADLISDMYRRIYVNDSPNVGQNYESDTVTSTAAQLVSTPLSGRKKVIIQNLGGRPVFIGFDASVTTSNGVRIGRNSLMELPFGEDLDLFAIAPGGNQSVRIMELA